MKTLYSIAFAMLFALNLCAQEETCTTPDTSIVDPNSITKCSIDDVKKTLDDVEEASTNVKYHKKRSHVSANSLNSVNEVSTEVKENTQLVSKLELKKDVLSKVRKIPFHLVEQIPLFEDCAEEPILEQGKCFEKKMAKHIIRNFSYPVEALNKKIEGKVLLQFTINESGKVIDIRSKAPKGCEMLEKEAVKLIGKLPDFIAGKHNGTNVKVKYALPITFKLPKNTLNITAEKKQENNDVVKNNNSDALTFDSVDQIPLFVSCYSSPKNEQKKCFEKELTNHITKNINYPKQAIISNIEGEVLIQFTIDKEGNVSGITKEGPENGEDLEIEAERLISTLPRLIPGIHNKNNVSVKYKIPISFKLPKS